MEDGTVLKSNTLCKHAASPPPPTFYGYFNLYYVDREVIIFALARGQKMSQRFHT